jgi:aspartyl-tRNA(Asn)/glutamyl-tRNA(Gln) amidotransferase subunit A
MNVHTSFRSAKRRFVLRLALIVSLTASLAPAGLRAADDLAKLTLAEAAAQVRSGKVTSLQLTEACLARIETFDPKLDAFITVMKSQALAQARALDAEAKAGKFRGPLHGVPVALKDNVDTVAARTTGGSALFADRIPAEDATVTTRLVAAGAVIIGKTNLQEFAMGGGETSYYGPSRNPWNLAHNTGGSSSGSGAAISAFLAYGAIGTDTGGSIRMPASFSGIVGLKPTYGLVPIRGIIPLRVSMDHAGPMTRTVEDTAIMLNVLAGFDKLDITSAERPAEDYVAAMKQPVNGMKLGLPYGYFDHLDPEVKAAFDTAIEVLNKLTSGSKEMSLPPAVRPLASGAETLAWHEDYVKSSAALYMIPERRRLEALAKDGGGTAVDYVKGMWENQLLRRTIDDYFAKAGVDLVVVPTHRILPPKIDDLIARAYDTKPADPRVTSNCSPFNIFGLPSISIPCGFSKSGLPIGLMISGPRWSEGKVLALARAYEQATEWHKRQPPLTPETPKPPVIKGT